MDKTSDSITSQHAGATMPAARQSRIPGVSKLALLKYLLSDEAHEERAARMRSLLKMPRTAVAPVVSAAPPTRYLRRRKVELITGHATSTIYRLMKEGSFPRPYQLGPNTVGWKESEILEWCETRKPRRRKDGLVVDVASLVGGRDE